MKAFAPIWAVSIQSRGRACRSGRHKLCSRSSKRSPTNERKKRNLMMVLRQLLIRLLVSIKCWTKKIDFLLLYQISCFKFHGIPHCFCCYIYHTIQCLFLPIPILFIRFRFSNSQSIFNLLWNKFTFVEECTLYLAWVRGRKSQFKKDSL